MSEFNFKSSVCTSREQSERLLALGLKKETADMEIHNFKDDEQETFEIGYANKGYMEPEFAEIVDCLPAWSLGRLVEIINKCNFESFESERWKKEAKKFCRYVLVSYSDDLIETSVEIIEALIEKGYFNKEYLV